MKAWWTLPVLGLMGGPALAATTPDGAVADCRRPGSGTERAICASPVLQAADQALAALFAEWRQRVPDAAAAQASQQDWLRRRSRMCGEAQRPQCLGIAFEEREAWLRAQLARLPEPMAPPPQPETPAPPVAQAPAATPVPRPQPEPPVAQLPAPRPQPDAPAAPAVVAAPPQPAPPRVLVPAVPPAVSVLSFAARLASAPCGAVSSTALRQQAWGPGDAPFGLPQPRWTQADYAALMRRATDCQAENMDSGRNLSLMTNLLNTLRANAPAAPQPASPGLPPTVASAPPPQPQPPLAPQSAIPTPPVPAPVVAAPSPPSAPAPASTAARANPGAGATPAQEPVALNCGDPALLQDVAYTFQSTPAIAAGARIQQMLRPRAYSDVVMEAYAATPALRTEYQRLLPYMAPVPQCLVDVETSTGRAVLSYRLYAEGGRTLIEVQRVP